jgi:hypothetical protein
MRALVLIVLYCAGCSDRTEVIVGVATDLQAMGQIDLVRLTASRQGTPIVQTEWPLVDVPAGRYELPGSFGLYSADGSETLIELSVKGYKSNNLVADRESQLSLVSGQTLFLRQTLTAACSPGARPQCKSDENCVEGVCQPATIDAHRLPQFRSELVTHLECTGGVHYIVSSTGMPMPTLADSCPADHDCHEGTCWKLPAGSGVNPCGTDDAGIPDGGCP